MKKLERVRDQSFIVPYVAWSGQFGFGSGLVVVAGGWGPGLGCTCPNCICVVRPF